VLWLPPSEVLLLRARRAVGFVRNRRGERAAAQMLPLSRVGENLTCTLQLDQTPTSEGHTLHLTHFNTPRNAPDQRQPHRWHATKDEGVHDRAPHDVLTH
jgi:hypothetical protein